MTSIHISDSQLIPCPNDARRDDFTHESSYVFASLMAQEIWNSPTFADARDSYRSAIACVDLALPSHHESDAHKLRTHLLQTLGAYKLHMQRLFVGGMNPSLN